MGIGERLHQALAKIVMRAAGYQAKKVCGNLHLCAVLESGTEGATHAMVQTRLERARQRRSEEEVKRPSVEEYEDEMEGADRLTAKTEVT